MKEILRKCAVSGERFDKRSLIRIVKDKEGNISIDPTGKKNGRGAYIQKDAEVVLKAKQKKVLNREFSMDVPSEVYDALIEYVNAK